MAMDANMNSLLKWSLQNSTNPDQQDPSSTTTSSSDPNAPVAAAQPPRALKPEMLASLFGGPSDADLMKASMAALQSPEVDLENKLTAFDNFEQLIENLDNANNMEPLGLWTPLVQLLSHEETEMRRMAAWCVGTAVQNNEKSQDRFLVLNAFPTLISIATSDSNPATRKKAVYAISSAVRNYQPALDDLLKNLPDGYTRDKVDAGDMDAIDAIMDQLRAHQPSA